MKVVAIMQNQWFHQPERVRRLLARRPESRERLIAYALFAGCKSGRVLRDVFGDRCDEIVWEEASREIGNRASAAFTADFDHLSTVIQKHAPSIALAFGRIAGDAMQAIMPSERLIVGPHPAARGPNVMAQLRQMRELLDKALADAGLNQPGEPT